MTAYERDLEECIEYFFEWIRPAHTKYWDKTPENVARVRDRLTSKKYDFSMDFFYGHIWAEERARRRQIMYGNPAAPEPTNAINAKDQK